jgi:hypothetical protein
MIFYDDCKSETNNHKSDVTIKSFTLDLTIKLLGVSFTLGIDVYSTGITYDHHKQFSFTIVICL